MESKLKRDDYIRSLDQLMTTSCILAGFAFSGLIALPSIDRSVFDKIVILVHGSFSQACCYFFYALFFSTLCFLFTIMTILVYKVSNYMVPLPKLRRIHWVANGTFSFAIAALTVAVITFGYPNTLGIVIATAVGLGIASCFLWENMVPWQRKRRCQQMSKEQQTEPKE